MRLPAPEICPVMGGGHGGAASGDEVVTAVVYSTCGPRVRGLRCAQGRASAAMRTLPIGDQDAGGQGVGALAGGGEAGLAEEGVDGDPPPPPGGARLPADDPRPRAPPGSRSHGRLT